VSRDTDLQGPSPEEINLRSADEVVLDPRAASPSLRSVPLQKSTSTQRPILSASLTTFSTSPLPKGSPVEARNNLASRYPVFELQPPDEIAHRDLLALASVDRYRTIC
jgi:hypothetical protein